MASGLDVLYLSAVNVGLMKLCRGFTRSRDSFLTSSFVFPMFNQDEIHFLKKETLNGKLERSGGRGCGALRYWQVGAEGNGEGRPTLSGIGSGSHGKHPPGVARKSPIPVPQV